MQTWRTSRTKDDRLYLGVLCEHCASPILFSLDRSEGNGPMSGPVKLVLTCAKTECARRADYSDAMVSRFRKVKMAPTPLLRTSSS